MTPIVLNVVCVALTDYARQRRRFLGTMTSSSDSPTTHPFSLSLSDFITDKLELADDIEFDRVHRLSGKPNSLVVARCCFYKHKEKMKERSKLTGSNIFIAEDFSQRVREIRKALTPHLKTARNQGKRAAMIYDHLLIEGKKFVLDKDNELKEFSRA